jgi:hypothetical protein
MDGIEAALKAVSAAEKLDGAEDFEVSKNRSRPYIEGAHNRALVNIMLDKVETDVSRSDIHEKTHRATFNFDMYVIGENDGLEPADEKAMSRLMLLTAQVEYAITALANICFGLQVSEIDYRNETALQFYPHEDDDSTAVYAPARMTLVLYFPYKVADLSNLPSLTRISMQALNDLALQYDYK